MDSAARERSPLINGFRGGLGGCHGYGGGFALRVSRESLDTPDDGLEVAREVVAPRRGVEAMKSAAATSCSCLSMSATAEANARARAVSKPVRAARHYLSTA